MVSKSTYVADYTCGKWENNQLNCYDAGVAK